MDNLSWFDSYRGPKRIIVEPGQATCWIGFRVARGNGTGVRKELYTYGPTLTRALAEAREVYESIPNRLPDSKILDAGLAKRRTLKRPQSHPNSLA